MNRTCVEAVGMHPIYSEGVEPVDNSAGLCACHGGLFVLQIILRSAMQPLQPLARINSSEV
jgi:hypothetical protein